VCSRLDARVSDMHLRFYAKVMSKLQLLLLSGKSSRATDIAHIKKSYKRTECKPMNKKLNEKVLYWNDKWHVLAQDDFHFFQVSDSRSNCKVIGKITFILFKLLKLKNVPVSNCVHLDLKPQNHFVSAACLGEFCGLKLCAFSRLSYIHSAIINVLFHCHMTGRNS
jgi:hypothetical protein